MFHLRPLHWMCAFDILQSKYQGFGFSSAPFSSLWWLVKWNSDYVVNQGLGKLSHDRGRNILTWRIRFAQKRCFQRPFVWSSVSWVYANLDWLVVSTPLKNISQLGWLFPKYGTIKTMFQTTNQWMFPTRRNEKAKWLASARTSQWDPMDRLQITRDLVAVISQQTYCWSKIKGHWLSLDITRYHKLLIPNCPTDCPVTVLPGLGIPGVIAAAAPEVPVLNHGILQILERPFGHLTGNAMENEPFIWSSCLTWRNIQFAMSNDQSLGGWDYILWYLLVACSFYSFSMSSNHILPVACLKKMKPNLCCLHPHCDRSPSMLHRTMWLCFNPGILLEPHLYQ